MRDLDRSPCDLRLLPRKRLLPDYFRALTFATLEVQVGTGTRQQNPLRRVV